MRQSTEIWWYVSWIRSVAWGEGHIMRFLPRGSGLGISPTCDRDFWPPAFMYLLSGQWELADFRASNPDLSPCCAPMPRQSS